MLNITHYCVLQLPSCVQLFATPWTAAWQASLSLTISQSLPKFMPITLVMPSSHLILWHFLLLLSSIFPSIRDFWVICSRQMTKILELQLQHQQQSFQGIFRVDLPLDLTGLISLLSKGLSGVFSSTTVQRHQLFGALLSLWSSSHNHTWPLGRP